MFDRRPGNPAPGLAYTYFKEQLALWVTNVRHFSVIDSQGDLGSSCLGGTRAVAIPWDSY